MEKEGSKRVEIAGIDDKRQITVLFGCYNIGDFLPIQIIYKGKTKRCLPSFAFPPDWHATFSHNHWSNERDYINKVLHPYIKKKAELKLPSDQRALLLFVTQFSKRSHVEGNRKNDFFIFFCST